MIVDPADYTAEGLAKISPTCGECGAKGTLVDGLAIYPHRPDLKDRYFWRCACGAYCGTHPNTINPLGAPANAETRRARSAAHDAFDPLWQKRQRLSGMPAGKARGKGYKWLAAQLGIEPKDCHIGMMDAPTARRVVEVCATATGKPPQPR